MLLYLQGLQAADTGDLLKAIDLYERSIAEDSTFAKPYAAITIPYFMTRQWDKGEWAAAKAIKLDDRAPEAFIANAVVLLYGKHPVNPILIDRQD